MSTRIQLRRGTAAQWTATNPVLADGEKGWEKDTGKFKVGDGVTAWNSLAYFTGGGGSPNIVSTMQVNDFTQAGSTGAVWTQLGDIAPSITISAGSRVRFHCHGRASESAAGALDLVRISVDSGASTVSLARWGMDAQGARLETVEIISGLSAGAHTFKVEYQKSGGGTLFVRAATQPQLERFGIILEEIKA